MDHSQCKCSWTAKPDHSPHQKQLGKSSQKWGDEELEDHKREGKDRKKIIQTTNMRDHSKRNGNI